jgi:hypothetical protein
VCLASFCGVAALRRIQRSSGFRRQLFAKPASLDLPISPARWRGRFGLASGFACRAPSLLADKILFDQKSVTVDDRLDRTRLWAPSLPVISPCVQLVALDFRVSNRPRAQVK